MVKTGLMLCISIVAALFCNLAHALPPQVEADMLMQEIAESTKAGKFSDQPEKFTRISGLKAKLPESFEFHWGKALHENRQYPQALTHLETYLTKIGSKGKYYPDALALYTKSKEIMAKEKSAYETALSVYEKKSSTINDEWAAYNEETKKLYKDYKED
jgi:hypothetical protein